MGCRRVVFCCAQVPIGSNFHRVKQFQDCLHLEGVNFVQKFLAGHSVMTEYSEHCGFHLLVVIHHRRILSGKRPGDSSRSIQFLHSTTDGLCAFTRSPADFDVIFHRFVGQNIHNTAAEFLRRLRTRFYRFRWLGLVHGPCLVFQCYWTLPQLTYLTAIVLPRILSMRIVANMTTG